MKKLLQGAALSLLLSTIHYGVSIGHAQGTAFTYQGRLNDGAAPANGSYDVAFSLYATNIGGAIVAGPVTNPAVVVSNGLFTTAVDFGNVFTGANRWLELAVSTNGANAFSTLSPRQALSPVPVALYARSASNVLGQVNASQLSGSIPATNLSGTVSLAQLPANVITNGASGVNFSGNFGGTFIGNGAGMTNVDLFYADDRDSIRWTTNYGVFALSSSPGVGVFPISVISADVNIDGKPDLICANWTLNTLTVLTNDGSGNFELSSSPAVGNGPLSVAAADINGDGKPDLISANADGNNLTVLTNNGIGNFGLSSSPGVGNAPQLVITADVNGDGKPDLISANANSNTLTVLTNNGSGNFTVSSSPGVGNRPFSVTSADVNEDGKMDLISANFSVNTLTILTNDGSGGFVVSSSPGVGNGPTSVTATDVNGDGKIDMISANILINTLTVLTNNGSGDFMVSSSPGVGHGPQSVTATDVNGDGKPDLISANANANTLTVLTNIGNGNFVVSSSLAAGGGPKSVIALDVNGDGKTDLISANFSGNTLTVLTNTLTFTANFVGDGSGLTSLNATNITGILDTAQIPNLDASKIASGTLGVAMIPNLDASKITTGALSDARLSSNVALLNTTQTFTGTNIFNGRVGMGTSSPAARLHIVSGEINMLALESTSTVGTWLDLINNSAGGRRWSVIATGSGNSEGAGKLLLLDPTSAQVRMTISTNGNVGVGTVSPAEKLHVVGNVQVDGYIKADALYASAPYLKCSEEQPKGTAAGGNIAGINVRNFNVSRGNTNILGSLSGSNIVLNAGTYQCRISAPGYRVDEHQIRLRTTGGTVLLYGTSEFSDDALNPGVQSRSLVEGQFTLATNSTLQVQHNMTLVKTVNGLGLPTSAVWTDGSPVEVYAVAEFWKIK